MNFVRFLENRFQELKLESDKHDAFDIKTESEIKAVHEIIGYFRSATKTFMMPKVIFDYILVEMGKKPEPQPVLTEMLKKQEEEKKAKKEKELENNVSPIQAQVSEQPKEGSS